jgi:hypothetical protein
VDLERNKQGSPAVGLIKKQAVVPLVPLLLIPVVLALGGMLFSLINPEIATGHPNYVRNYHLLSLLRNISFLASGAAAVVLWLLVCFQVIRSKGRSYLWLFLATLGPLGFAVLVTLNDRDSTTINSHARFVRNMNWYLRAGYELCTFVIVWVLAYQTMVLKRILMIKYEAVTTGISTAQIIDRQNASSGMWAFAEGLEVMYLVVLLYLLRPIVFEIVRRAATMMASSKAR